MGKTYTRIHRLLRLITAIQSKRDLNAADLARLCEVHERTIFRDVETLNASGVPCAFDEATHGYRLGAAFFMPPVELTFEEAMAIVALSEEIGDRHQIPFIETVSRVAQKLRAQLPAAVLEAIEPLADHVHIDLARRSADDSDRDVYDQMCLAIAQRRVLVCTYEAAKHAAGGDSAEMEHDDFEFRPYGLWFCQRAWYAVGHHGSRNAIRRLKLNRFTSVRTTDCPFDPPKHFDLHADLGQAWRMIRGEKRYAVAVRFEPGFADAASETRWHPTQEEEWDADGRVTLRFSIDGLDEIVWWVLGYGPGVTVLEPVELVDRLRQLTSAMAKRYSEKVETA